MLMNLYLACSAAVGAVWVFRFLHPADVETANKVSRIVLLTKASPAHKQAEVFALVAFFCAVIFTITSILAPISFMALFREDVWK
jgi:hypothetical protein